MHQKKKKELELHPEVAGKNNSAPGGKSFRQQYGLSALPGRIGGQRLKSIVIYGTTL